MGLNNPKSKSGGEFKTQQQTLSPEAAERQMKEMADRKLGMFARFKVGREQSQLAKETAIELARESAKATREIGITAIELRKQQVKLNLVAGNMHAIASLQGELFNRYAIAGEEMLTSQAVATKSLIQSRTGIKTALIEEARAGRLSESEAIELLNEVDTRTAEQEGRLNLVAESCQDNLQRLTLSVVQQMNSATIKN